jgi:uncharacterized membrane protein YukC
MAILIEEEKQGGGKWFGFGILIIILVVLAISVYYLFFVSPELINTVIPAKLQVINDVKQLSDFNPTKVLNSPFYKSLKQVIPPPSPPPAGNASPFGVF